MAKRKKPIAEASDAVRFEWLRRVEAEYGSAAVTQHLTLWLMMVGASPDLIKEGMRIAWDEMVHARMSHEAYLAAGGTDVPKIVRENLGLRRIESAPLEHDVTRVVVNTFCIGETVAVPLFKNLREGCTVLPARRVLDRVLRDEVRHRDFGWTALAWLFESPMGPELRRVSTEALPRYFEGIRNSYGASLRHVTETSPADRAWGLMAPARYFEIVEATLRRDWIPRFGELGIDAERAWNAGRASPIAHP